METIPNQGQASLAGGNTPAANAGVLRLETTGTIAKAIPTLSSGQILNLLVRQVNPEQGKGILLFQGNTVQATLPEFLAAGDKLTASVSREGNALLLKLLAVERPGIVPQTSPSQSTGPQLSTEQVKALATELEKYLFSSIFAKTASPIDLASQSSQQALMGPQQSLLATPAAANATSTNPQSSGATYIPQIIKDSTTVKELLTLLGTTTPTDSGLADKTLAQVKAAGDGSLVSLLRETAKALKTLVTESTPRPEVNALELLQRQLAPILEQIKNGESLPTRTVEIFLRNALSDIANSASEKGETKLTTRALVTLEAAIRTLQQHPNQTSSEGAKVLQSLFENLEQLTQNARAEQRGKSSSGAATNLQQIATRLEQLAQTQETLQRLNPVMKAMGEPALILFPFILHGLLNHSEISIHNHEVDPEGKKKKGSEGDFSNLQRIEITVPLPYLGKVHVNIAHSETTIIANLRSEDEQVVMFLEEKLEHLVGVLRERGFEQAELRAMVGEMPRTAVTQSREALLLSHVA